MGKRMQEIINEKYEAIEESRRLTQRRYQAKLTAKQRSKMVPKWISVEDGLPENNKTILCFGEEGFHITYRLLDPKGWCFVDLSFDGFRILEGVTHWMPLPEKPEGK